MSLVKKEWVDISTSRSYKLALIYAVLVGLTIAVSDLIPLMSGLVQTLSLLGLVALACVVFFVVDSSDDVHVRFRRLFRCVALSTMVIFVAGVIELLV